MDFGSVARRFLEDRTQALPFGRGPAKPLHLSRKHQGDGLHSDFLSLLFFYLCPAANHCSWEEAFQARGVKGVDALKTDFSKLGVMGGKGQPGSLHWIRVDPNRIMSHMCKTTLKGGCNSKKRVGCQNGYFAQVARQLSGTC